MPTLNTNYARTHGTYDGEQADGAYAVPRSTIIGSLRRPTRTPNASTAQHTVLATKRISSSSHAENSKIQTLIKCGLRDDSFEAVGAVAPVDDVIKGSMLIQFVSKLVNHESLVTICHGIEEVKGMSCIDFLLTSH